MLILACFLYITSAQALSTLGNNLNSTATLTPAQISAAGIDSATASKLAVAVEYERSNYAFGSVDDDPFYRVPSNTANATAGTLLKVEAVTNTSAYALPPNTALSRIIFQSEGINGSVVPVSAFVLWPYMPRSLPDGWPVVAWAHGASGEFGNCAPSHMRSLDYEFGAPYTLALQGYVVVAPDYAGLGVDKDASGKPIAHSLLANPLLANDVFFAVEAAQSAFSQLSKKFIIMGHSEGGGAAWGAAQRQATRPVAGYLGAIAGSPLTRVLDHAPALDAAADIVCFGFAAALSTIYPDFQSSDALTPAGEKLVALAAEIQGCSVVQSVLFAETGLVKPGWSENYYAQAWQNLTANGGKPIAGPFLVLQGESDLLVPYSITTAAVNSTCTAYPKTQLEYVSFANVTHIPVMFASQRTWLDWINDRFAGKVVSEGCHTSRIDSARPYQNYQAETNWYLGYATQAYEIA